MIENHQSEHYIISIKFCNKLSMLMGQHFCCVFEVCPVENVIQSDYRPLLLFFFYMTVKLYLNRDENAPKHLKLLLYLKIYGWDTKITKFNDVTRFG